jgi:hypothetical protein
LFEKVKIMKLKRLTTFGLLTFAFLLLTSSPAWSNDRVLVINDSTLPVPVTGTIGASMSGAAHEANSQVTATGTAGTLIIARATRVGCLIKNTDASITVYIGAATVTAANGMPLKAGESVVVSAQTLIQVISASGSPVVAVFDEYN